MIAIHTVVISSDDSAASSESPESFLISLGEDARKTSKHMRVLTSLPRFVVNAAYSARYHYPMFVGTLQSQVCYFERCLLRKEGLSSHWSGVLFQKRVPREQARQRVLYLDAVL